MMRVGRLAESYHYVVCEGLNVNLAANMHASLRFDLTCSPETPGAIQQVECIAKLLFTVPPLIGVSFQR